MKKSVFLLLVVLLSASIAFAQTQETKKKVAIYIVDNSEMNMGKFAGDYIVDAIVKRGTYSAIDRTADFLAQLKKEQSYQQSGQVDDKELSHFGKLLGVHSVCMVTVEKMGTQYYLSARLIDVETAILDGTASPQIFSDISVIECACSNVVSSLYKENTKNCPSSSKPITSLPIHTPPSAPEQQEREISGIKMIYVEGLGSGISSTKGFYMGKYEVTQQQWVAVMGSNPSENAGCTTCPVENVTFDMAQLFIRKLNEQTGEKFRLPTADEWGYAAGGGKNYDLYVSTGKSAPDGYQNNTTAVSNTKPNSVEICGMSGNVTELCQDGVYRDIGQENNGRTAGSGGYTILSYKKDSGFVGYRSSGPLCFGIRLVLSAE